MKVIIDLSGGHSIGMTYKSPTKSDIDKNIEAVDRAINGLLRVVDTNYLIDTRSILSAIRAELPWYKGEVK